MFPRAIPFLGNPLNFFSKHSRRFSELLEILLYLLESTLDFFKSLLIFMQSFVNFLDISVIVLETPPKFLEGPLKVLELCLSFLGRSLNSLGNDKVFWVASRNFRNIASPSETSFLGLLKNLERLRGVTQTFCGIPRSLSKCSLIFGRLLETSRQSSDLLRKFSELSENFSELSSMALELSMNFLKFAGCFRKLSELHEISIDFLERFSNFQEITQYSGKFSASCMTIFNESLN